MSDVPLRSDLDRMVDRYLSELGQALQRLPVSERDHLLSEIREHITELRSERPVRDAWDMEALLNRVGLPEDIAAVALENLEEVEDPVDPVPAPVPVAATVAAAATPTPPPTPERPRSRRTRLVVGLVAAALVLVVAVSVAATRHGSFIGSTSAPLSVVPATGPSRPHPPLRVTVPNVIGTTVAQATADLQAAGLSVTSISGFSNSLPVGEVFSQSPAGGSLVVPGSAVTLDISSGTAS